MARWYRRYRRSSYRRSGKKWSPTTQVVNTATSSGSQKSLPIAFNHTGERVGTTYPIGPIMKVKYFRLNIVFESSVTVLWALVYVPDGLPIGRLNVAGTGVDSTPGALYEPQQFIITSGVYTSQGSSGASRALASLDAPSQESQSGRRGVPRLAGLNVSLINPDYRHRQLLELCELNQKRWSNHLQYQTQPPSGGVGGAKERSEATRGPPPRRCGVPKGPTH